MRLPASLIACGLVLTLLQTLAVQAAGAPDGKFNLWIYYQTNLSDSGNLAKTIEMVKRCKKAGYTGIAYLDGRLMHWSDASPPFIENLHKLRQACTENGMDLVATVLPLGYANALMWDDPNLAEAQPVVDAPFVVKDGKLVSDDPTRLINGTFEDNKDNVPAGWSVDGPGKACFIDNDVKCNGKCSLRMEDIKNNDQYEHARAWQHIKVKPYQYYHLSVAVKTENYTGRDNRLMAMGTTAEHQGRLLHIPEFTDIKKTQDWKVYHKTFNTAEFTDMAIYVGSWEGGTGKIWWADVKFEPAGLSDMVRRDGAPFKATTADGKSVLEEGKDLGEMKDPGLGMSPSKTGYQWHVGPTPAIPAGSRLKEGDKALLSYYHTSVMCYNDQVPICLSEPKTYELIETCVQNVQKHLQPDYWFMEHDEIRMQGWDKSCQDTGKTCGQILGDNIARCTAIIRKHSPDAKGIYVWSDLFDPYHNAGSKGESFAVCKGINPWDKSWEGLPKEVGLINWNAGKPDSVKFFSDQGHPQVISTNSPSGVVQILNRSAGLKGVSGAIYVTWSGDFGNVVEKYAEAVLKWKDEQANKK